MQTILRVSVPGAAVDLVDMPTALEFVDRQVAAGETAQCILAMNPEKTYLVRRDPDLAEFFRQGALLIPDGIGVVLAARLIHGARLRRLAGADLMEAICRRAAQRGHRVYVYGAAEEVNKGAVDELRRRYAGLEVCGRSHGYVPADRMDDLIANINDSHADILFVALGSPRQERWMRQFQSRLHVKVCMGIGGTLDTITGKVKRAPKFFCRSGLEWFYRLLTEPMRVRRQVVLPLFAWDVLRTLLFAGRSHPTARGAN